MACGNGDGALESQTKGCDVKLLVFGERKCGKTSLIEAFVRSQTEEEYFQEDRIRVYPLEYNIRRNEVTKAKIYEMPWVPEDQVRPLIKDQIDANGFVFVFAIDDPSSLSKARDKWMHLAEVVGIWRGEPAIVVGAKRDLRENQHVIQRLAANNETPVSREMGEELALSSPHIRKYFEFSCYDPTESTDIFGLILGHGLGDLEADESGLKYAG